MLRLKYLFPTMLLFGVSMSVCTQAAPVLNAQDVSSARNNQEVSLRGEIVSQQAKNQYLLTDGTGNVLVEISDDLLKGNRLAPGTEVEVEGKVDVRLLRDTKVDAQAVTVLALHNVPPAGMQPSIEAPDQKG